MDVGEGFPAPPFVVAANHHSFLDPLLMGATYRRKIRFLGLVDLFGNHRWLDLALAAFEVIPLKRDTVPLGPVRLALGHLANEGVVGMFPEGTRHHVFDPRRALPGAAWLAMRAGVPLVPIAISGTEQVLGVENRLHMGEIRIRVGPALHGVGTGRSAVDHLTGMWGDWVWAALGSAP
jgi:1-acyl-sn-glycerol-3-phosphate acyltransferase